MIGGLAAAVSRPAVTGHAPRAARAAENGHAPSDAALRRAARDFETQAIGLLLQPVFATTDTSRSPFGGGAAEAQWRPMLVEAYAAAAVRAGGFGLSEPIHRELARQAARNREIPARGAAPAGSTAP